MKAYHFVVFFSTIIWSLIPLFYRTHKFFYFFLYLAIIELSGIFLFWIFHISPISLWLSLHILILFSFNRDFLSKYKIGIFIIFLISLPISFTLPNITHNYIIFFFHVLFLLLFIRYFLSIYFNNNKIDLFFLTMILYEMLNVFKLISFLRDLKTGINIFYVTSITQILIGIFLIILRTKMFSNFNTLELENKVD
jgi:hypothetical protein